MDADLEQDAQAKLHAVNSGVDYPGRREIVVRRLTLTREELISILNAEGNIFLQEHLHTASGIENPDGEVASREGHIEKGDSVCKSIPYQQEGHAIALRKEIIADVAIEDVDRIVTRGEQKQDFRFKLESLKDEEAQPGTDQKCACSAGT